MNTVSIIGNLTRDPEERDNRSDVTIVELGIAVNGREKKGDEWQDRADFFDVVVFGRLAENCLEYLAKGRKVGITGRLRQERWQTDSGDNRSRVKIIASAVDFLTPKGEQGEEPASSSSGGGGKRYSQDDDDIPF